MQRGNLHNLLAQCTVEENRWINVCVCVQNIVNIPSPNNEKSSLDFKDETKIQNDGLFPYLKFPNQPGINSSAIIPQHFSCFHSIVLLQ